MMEEVSSNEGIPDLKDLEVKVGRKTPDGLLRWMRQDAAQRGEQSKVSHQESTEPAHHTLDEKIRTLKVEMAHLRAVDVRILQQLLALHEGIEAAKWMLEDRGTLTSHCSSLTGSQYSLGGSWSSLHEPHDKLDNISIGSYLDTLADDLDEYCTSSGAESILCSAPVGTDTSKSSRVKTGGPKEDGRPSPSMKQDYNNEEVLKKTTRVLDTAVKKVAETDSPAACLAERLGKNLSPKGKTYKNGKVEPESCKLSGKVHMEYDAHWRWVQSQDDVTFLVLPLKNIGNRCRCALDGTLIRHRACRVAVSIPPTCLISLRHGQSCLHVTPDLARGHYWELNLDPRNVGLIS